MNDMSYTISIERKGDRYKAWAESTRKIINGPAASAHGKTPLEAAENAYQALVALMAEEQELADSAEIDATWDELTPDDTEFSDELEAAVKALIAMVREGMAENEQQRMSGWIHEFLAVISVNRLCSQIPHG